MKTSVDMTPIEEITFKIHIKNTLKKLNVEVYNKHK